MSLYSFTSIRYGGHEVSVLLKEVNLFQGMINYLSRGGGGGGIIYSGIRGIKLLLKLLGDNLFCDTGWITFCSVSHRIRDPCPQISGELGFPGPKTTELWGSPVPKSLENWGPLRRIRDPIYIF